MASLGVSVDELSVDLLRLRLTDHCVLEEYVLFKEGFIILR